MSAKGKSRQSGSAALGPYGWITRAANAGRMWVVWSVLLVVAAALLRLLFLQGLGTNVPYITFYPAVAIAALYRGLRAGFLTLTLSAAVAIYFWVEPMHTLASRNPFDWLLLGTFLATTALISFVAEAMHRARARAHAAIEREVAALAQHEADERLRFALEQSHTGGWSLDLTDHAMQRTLRYDQIFGYETLLPEWTYEKFLEHVLPEDRAEVDRQFHAATDTPNDWSFECRIRRKDGEARWISVAGGHQRDAAGKARHMSGIVKDITERKQADDRVRQSEQMLRELLDGLGPDTFLGLMTREGVLLEANRPALAAAGLRPGDVVGKPFAETYWWAYSEPVQAQLRGAIARAVAGEPSRYDVQVRVAESRLIWIDFSLHPIRDASGQVIYLVPSGNVIDERKQAEEEIRQLNVGLEQKNIELAGQAETLRATQSRLQSLLEHSPAVIYSLKVDGERVVPHVVSENITRLLGFTVEESCNFDWWVTHLHPDDREQAIADISETIKRGILNTEYRIQNKGGKYVWVEDNRRLVRDAQGRPTDIVGVWTNISERKQAQSQLLRAQRLESIGTLAGGIAHDLNNALAPVLMATEILRMEYPDAKEIVDTIESSARRGADMVRQLLTFAKGVEGQRLLLQPAHLLQEMEKIIKGSFPKNIQLRIKYQPRLETILGDATQLHQVLLNLCVNARDAMPGGGTLTIEAENVEIDATYASTVPEAKPGHYVAWRVSDTGTGIPPEILDRIFEPFFSTKGPDKGTGLGLSTLLGIVKSHGGFVRVYSQLGSGSTFAIYLSASGSNADITDMAHKAEPGFRGNGETVLVVDDEPAVRRVARTVLSALNFHVLTAADGTEALIQVAEKRAELRAVITDMHMPYMDGLSFVRVLKHMLPEAGIIVTSGHLSEKETSEFKALGIEVLLTKPFTQEKLTEALKAVLKR